MKFFVLHVSLAFFLVFTGIKNIFPFEGSIMTGTEDTGIISAKRTEVFQSDTARLNRQISEARNYLKNKEKMKARSAIGEAFRFATVNRIPVPYTLFWVSAEVALSSGDLSQAFEQSAKALALLKPTLLYREYCQVALFRSKILVQVGKFSSAMELLQQIAALAAEKNLKGILPEVYRDLSNLCKILNDPAGEKNYNTLMLESATHEQNRDMMARAWFRLGEFSLRSDSNFYQSNRNYREALRIRTSMNDSAAIPLILNRLAWNHYLMKKYDTSLLLFNQCIAMGMAKEDYSSLANSYGNIGTIYRDLNDYSNALENYGRSSAYSLSTGDWFNLSWVYHDMSKLFINTGDYKKAYESYVLYKQYNDSLNKRNYNTGLADARMRYETETREKEIELLAVKLDKQKYVTYGFAILILLAAVVGVLLYRQSRLNNRRKISEMNRKIAEITQANLRQQMNPHFIFNTLNSIQYYMYQHDKIATNNYLTKFSSLMRKTLENSRFTSIPIRDELEALELYLELEVIRFKDKFTYTISVDEEIDTLLYKIPTMLIQPYVENAIVHGIVSKEGNGTLKIDILYRKDHLLCIVEDDGIGREAAGKINNRKEHLHSSLGTKIAETRLELAGAVYGNHMKVIYHDLHDPDGNPSGTRVEIQIPFMS